MKWPDKKYRVRVSCCQTGLYHVQWAFYRFIPIWQNIVRFEKPNVCYEHCVSGWESKVFRHKEAEEFAQSINTIEKLSQYIEKQNNKEREYLKDKAFRDKNSTPYRTKNIV